jgi:hypothetical protein
MYKGDDRRVLMNIRHLCFGYNLISNTSFITAPSPYRAITGLCRWAPEAASSLVVQVDRNADLTRSIAFEWVVRVMIYIKIFPGTRQNVDIHFFVEYGYAFKYQVIKSGCH